MRTRTIGCLVALLSAWPLVAGADPTPEGRALARSLFDEGRALGREGRFGEACPKLEESQRLDPGIGTEYNLADCYEHTGRTASAWSMFGEVADIARQTGQAERERVARARVAQLEPKLSRLVLRAAAAVEIALDGRAVGKATLGSAIPVDPGDHQIEGSAPGKRAWTSTVKVPASNTVSVDVGPLEDEPVAAPAVAPPATNAPSPPPSTESPPPHPPSVLPTVAIAGAGVGVVAAGIGTFFGLRARSRWADAEPHCPGGVCDATGYPAWHEAHSSATAATVSFVVAGASLAAAIVLWALAPSSDGPTTRSASLPGWRF